jgi:tetratricopeptide (TPR) repeat protein/O-antigen ligase
MINKESREKIYFSIIEWGTYLSLFTPLVFFRQFFFPFVVPKTIFFRLIVDIIFIAYILLVISNRKYLPKINVLTIAVTIFLDIVILTSFTGVNPEKSFWSVFERMTGLLTFFHLYAFYIILSSVFKEKKYWERILTVSMIVGVLLCFYVWTSDETFARGGGTVGNTSFLAGYLLFDIFFALVFFFTKDGAWKITYGVLSLTLILGLFVSQEPCRGAINAFWGGLFILGFGYLVFRLFSSGKKSLKILAFSLPLILILIGIGLLQLDFFKGKITEIWQSGSIQSRLMVWKIGFEGWKERFWLGWGQENFNIPFVKYFDPALPLAVDVWYDRAHNIVFDTAVTSGILGLISYLAIFGVAIFSLARLFPRVADRKNVFLPLGMIAVLMVYFAQNIWVFDMISSYVMFFLTLAFISFLISSPKEELEPEYSKKEKPLYYFTGALLIIITLLTFYFGNIQPARASNFVLQSLFYPLEQSVPSFEKALQASPISKFEIPEQFSRTIIDLALKSKDTKDREILEKGFKLAEEGFKNNLKQEPLNFRPYLFLGEYYRNLYQVTQNKELLNLGEETLRRAMELSPKNQQVYWALGQTLVFQGKNEEAVGNFQKAVNLEPRLALSHWYLFLVYKNQSKYELALQEFKRADELGYNWKKDLNNLKSVIELYRNLKDNNSLIAVVEEGVKNFPQDAYLLSNLADIYATAGEREKAKETAEKILKLRPDLSDQIEAFLKSLGY